MAAVPCGLLVLVDSNTAVLVFSFEKPDAHLSNWDFFSMWVLSVELKYRFSIRIFSPLLSLQDFRFQKWLQLGFSSGGSVGFLDETAHYLLDARSWLPSRFWLFSYQQNSGAQYLVGRGKAQKFSSATPPRLEEHWPHLR